MISCEMLCRNYLISISIIDMLGSSGGIVDGSWDAL